MNLIPPIGASGLYELTDPFNTLINPNISYTCMAVRKISDIIAFGEDPYKIYYQPYGITEQAYANDANSGVCVVSLQSSAGVWIYVPSSHIRSYPDANGIPYSSIALMVNLGAIPDSLNLSFVKNTVTDIVSGILGITPEVQSVVTSPRTMISQDNHTSAEAARQLNISKNTTDYSTVQRFQDENTTLRARIAQLEAYILAHP